MRAPVSPAVLAGARRSQESSMTDRAIIRRSTPVDDGGGGSTEVVSFLGPYFCRVGVSKLQRGEILVAGQLQGGLPWIVTFPALTDVRLSDRINVDGTVVSNDFVGGRNFEILAIYAATSFETARQCVCAER